MYGAGLLSCAATRDGARIAAAASASRQIDRRATERRRAVVIGTSHGISADSPRRFACPRTTYNILNQPTSNAPSGSAALLVPIFRDATPGGWTCSRWKVRTATVTTITQKG